MRKVRAMKVDYTRNEKIKDGENINRNECFSERKAEEETNKQK